MLSFKYQNFSPPGGRWFYTVPETGLYLESALGMHDLLGRIEQHYAAIKKPVPESLQLLVEDHICLRVAAGFCCGKDPRSKDQQPPTFFEIIGNMETFFRGKAPSYVAHREADIRATTCTRCENNSLAMCTSCNGMRQQATQFVSGRKLPQDAFLGVCTKIRIPCNALVHVAEPPGAEGLPGHCWIVKP